MALWCAEQYKHNMALRLPLGAQSHVAVSFETPEYTGQVDGLGTLRVLEAVRLLGMQNDVEYIQAKNKQRDLDYSHVACMQAWDAIRSSDCIHPYVHLEL